MKGWAQPFLLCFLLFVSLGSGYAAAQEVHTAAASHEIAHGYTYPNAAQLRLLPSVSWKAEVEGMKLRYHLVSLAGFSSQGYFVFAEATRTCHIYLDRWFARHASRLEHLEVVFHEVGHCVDASKLRFSHNAFGPAGCTYGEYYCAPAEGYAQAWRYAYTARCGFDAAAIGYEAGLETVRQGSAATATERCKLPTAESVRPPLFAARLAERRP